MSIAIFTIAVPVRFPARVCSIHSLPCWMVNSISCMSLKYSSSFCSISKSSLAHSGIVSSRDGYFNARSSSEIPCNFAHRREPSSVICNGVRMPATTSSPCALIRYSPVKISSPVAGSRVKATPVAEVFPMFPKTIACTFTAVPHSSGILFSFRLSKYR